MGGVNAKIEGYFRICEKAGLDGSHGVLIPDRNRRHLMLDHKVIDAVGQGLFHIYTSDHVSTGMELLTGSPFGAADETGNFPPDSVLGHAQKTLLAYRRAFHMTEHPKTARKHLG